MNDVSKPRGSCPPTDGLDPSEDPALLMSVGIVVSRRQLRKSADVRRLVREIPKGYEFDSVGMGERVKQVCRGHDLDLDDVGEWNIDRFCELVEAERKASRPSEVSVGSKTK